MKKLISITGLVSLLFMVSCSTLSFLPTEGGASKFNLATVEYVQAQNTAQQAELLADISQSFAAQLDSLLAGDREQLGSFALLLDSLETSLDALSAKIDTSNQNLENSLAGMSKELTIAKTNASNTRTVLRRLNDEMETLPKTTLITFNKAITEYLKKIEAEAATVTE